MKWSPMDAINSEAKLRLLAYLFSHVSASMSATEIAILIALAPMTVTRLLKELENDRIISIKRVGSSHVCSLNTKSYSCRALRSIFRLIGAIPAPLEHLKLTIKNALPLKMVEHACIYGSVARNESSDDSDIDLLIIVKGAGDKMSGAVTKALEDLNIKCLDLYGMKVEWRIISKKDATGPKFKDLIDHSIPIFS